MNCPGGNATDPIWRVLASSQGISSWTPLKPQHSNPNPNPLANQLWCIDFLTPPHLSSSLIDSPTTLNLLCHPKTDARFMQDAPKAVWSIPYASVALFPSLKYNFIAYLLKCPDVQIAFLKFTSCENQACCCSYSFEAEIIKIGQSSHKMYCNNIENFQESTTFLNACTKKSGNLLNARRITETLCNNGFPEAIVRSVIRDKVAHFHKIKVASAQKCPMYLRLPWLGDICDHFAD